MPWSRRSAGWQRIGIAQFQRHECLIEVTVPVEQDQAVPTIVWRTTRPPILAIARMGCPAAGFRRSAICVTAVNPPLTGGADPKNSEFSCDVAGRCVLPIRKHPDPLALNWLPAQCKPQFREE